MKPLDNSSSRRSLMPKYLTADEAADALDVTKNTLYAYVSRGLIRSEPDDEQRRTRRYRASDVRRHVRKKKMRSDPAAAAESALDFGLPVMESALTLIDEGRTYYRGQDVCTLADTHTLEEGAALLWDLDAPLSLDDVAISPIETHADAMPNETLRQSPVPHMQALLPTAEKTDPQAFARSRMGVAKTGFRLLKRFTDVVQTADAATPSESRSGPVHERLCSAWNVSDAAAHSLVRMALVLCADHGLNVTAFTARCVASAGATPYGAVNAALSALQGRRHVGNAARVDALFREAQTPDRLETTVIRRMQRGDAVPIASHSMYPDGDPRAMHLLNALDAHCPDAEGTAFGREAQRIARDVLDRRPTIDLALVACARALHLPSHAPLTLFAVGRTVGWIGHIHEQYTQDTIIRPRARYTGPPPAST